MPLPPRRQVSNRVHLYAAIRRNAQTGLSKRTLQRKHGDGYGTVTNTLTSAWPKEPKLPPNHYAQLALYKSVIDGWLPDDLDTPRNQRHPAMRIYDRLLDEHAEASVVSYRMVRDYVAARRLIRKGPQTPPAPIRTQVTRSNHKNRPSRDGETAVHGIGRSRRGRQPRSTAPPTDAAGRWRT